MPNWEEDDDGAPSAGAAEGGDGAPSAGAAEGGGVEMRWKNVSKGCPSIDASATGDLVHLPYDWADEELSDDGESVDDEHDMPAAERGGGGAAAATDAGNDNDSSGGGGGGGHGSLSSDSDSDSAASEREGPRREAGAYDASDFSSLDVTAEVRDLFAYIGTYRPRPCELDMPLRCMLPDYIPAIGDTADFIAVPRPDGRPDGLGLRVLDEDVLLRARGAGAPLEAPSLLCAVPAPEEVSGGGGAEGGGAAAAAVLTAAAAAAAAEPSGGGSGGHAAAAVCPPCAVRAGAGGDGGAAAGGTEAANPFSAANYRGSGGDEAYAALEKKVVALTQQLAEKDADLEQLRLQNEELRARLLRAESLVDSPACAGQDAEGGAALAPPPPPARKTG